MTDKEALEYLDRLADGATNLSHDSNEACRIGAEAVRERMEREQGCPWCKEDAEGYVRKAGAYSIHNGMLMTGHCKPMGIKYCPMCGRPLKTAMQEEEV